MFIFMVLKSGLARAMTINQSEVVPQETMQDCAILVVFGVQTPTQFVRLNPEGTSTHTSFYE